MSEHKTDAKWVKPDVPGRVSPVATAARLVNRRLRSLDGDALRLAAPTWMIEAADMQAEVDCALTGFLPKWQAARKISAGRMEGTS